MLARPAEHGAAIANRFDHGAAHVRIRTRGAKQHAGDGSTGHATIVFPYQSQLRELDRGRFSGTRTQETIHQGRVEGVGSGCGDDRFVRTEQARTPPLLKQAMQCFRRQFTLGTALTGKVSPGALVNQRALFDFGDQDERTDWQSHPLGNKRQGGDGCCRRKSRGQRFLSASICCRFMGCTSPASDTPKNKVPPLVLPKAANLVGNGVPMRLADTVAGEHDLP